MSVADTAAYVVGSVGVVVFAIGMLAFLTEWAIERVVNALGLTSKIIAWHVDRQRSKRVRG